MAAEHLITAIGPYGCNIIYKLQFSYIETAFGLFFFCQFSVYLLFCFIRNLFHRLADSLVNRFLINVSVSF